MNIEDICPLAIFGRLKWPLQMNCCDICSRRKISNLILLAHSNHSQQNIVFVFSQALIDNAGNWHICLAKRNIILVKGKVRCGGRKVNVWRADTISTTAMQPCVSITLSPDVDADSTWVDTSCHSFHIIVNSKDIQQSMWYRIYHYKILYKVWIDDEEWNAWHVPYVSTSATKIYFLHIYSFFYIYSESLARAICVNKLNKKIMICASDASSTCRSVGIE